MNDDDWKERVDVWMTADDLDSLNFIRYKHGGASKATTVRVCVRLVKHWIETGKFPELLP